MTSSTVLSRELREAVRSHGLTVAYQPIFDLIHDGPVPRHPVGVEALCRWTHPTLGVIVPGLFIPLAERAGLISDLCTEVLGQAGPQVSSWQHAGHAIGLSLNASPSQFSPGFLATLVGSIREFGLAPGSLTIEVTEAPVPQLLPNVLEVLPRLEEAGIGISIDDYGAGDVTIEVLGTLPIEEVKIDRSLTQRTDAAADDEVRRVVALADHRGWRVVAEGIETIADLERSRARGCHRGQGFLLGRPMPASDLGQLLNGSQGR